jgi:hypothetical protein
MKEPLSSLTSSEAPPPGVARDPVRLLAGGGSAFERGLLESVAGDRMSQASEQRLAQLFELPQARDGYTFIMAPPPSSRTCRAEPANEKSTGFALQTSR